MRFYYAAGRVCGYGGYREHSAVRTRQTRDSISRPKGSVLGGRVLFAYWVNSAGRPVKRSIRFAIGGWVENKLPKFMPRNG
jgi:hypothetical protein